jgi:hypothetical protein
MRPEREFQRWRRCSVYCRRRSEASSTRFILALKRDMLASMRHVFPLILVLTLAAGRLFAFQGSVAPKRADVIVAGALEPSSASDSGSQVTVSGAILVRRVIRGSAAPDARLPVAWAYEPRLYENPAVTTRPPKVFGLWFLERNGDTYRPFSAGPSGPWLGGRLSAGCGIRSGGELDPVGRGFAGGEVRLGTGPSNGGNRRQ